MKPQDAKEKFCPFFAQADAISIDTLSSALLASDKGDEAMLTFFEGITPLNSKCRGPDCMMWVLKAPSGGDCALKTR